MKPRILLVEDDAVSAAFLEAAIASLPACVAVAASAAQAMRLAMESDHDLYLIDANLPDASGIELLATLRTHAPATPALAHTADTDGALHTDLRAAGFGDVLLKPIAKRELQRRLHDILSVAADAAQAACAAVSGTDELPLWDDAAALRALGGNAENVRSLRVLFLQELAQQRQAVLTGDPHERRDLLHRLLASCGFVGAMRLRGCVTTLHRAPADAAALREFADVSRMTLEWGQQAGWQAPA